MVLCFVCTLTRPLPFNKSSHLFLSQTWTRSAKQERQRYILKIEEILCFTCRYLECSVIRNIHIDKQCHIDKLLEWGLSPLVFPWLTSVGNKCWWQVAIHQADGTKVIAVNAQWLSGHCWGSPIYLGLGTYLQHMCLKTPHQFWTQHRSPTFNSTVPMPT